MKQTVSCVYIMTNKRNGTLYTGVTSDLQKRVQEHKGASVSGFTQRYGLHTLVYYKCGDSIVGAIEEEKRIKAGSRKKKLALIEEMNPAWNDLTDSL
jgi:putative endonuclease